MRINDKTKAFALILPAAGLLLAGCSSNDSGSDASSAAATTSSTSATAAPSSETESTATCKKSTGEVVKANSKPGEPQFSLVVPDNDWQRNTTKDSDVVRLVLVNKALAANQFAPNVVFTVEQSPATDIGDETTRQLAGLNQQGVGATDIKKTVSGTVCGDQTQTITYKLATPGGPERDVTAVIVMVPNGASGSTVAVLTAQTTEPDNPQYQKAVTMMTEELQIQK